MAGDRKAKSFSLESSEREDGSSVSARRSSSSLADIRELGDDDYRALLDKAFQASYKRTHSNTSNSDTGQVVVASDTLPVRSSDDYALPSTGGLSKDAQNIYTVLKEAADRDAFGEDEAIEVRFDQKKLGKSASHESCQPKPSRPSSGRHSVYSMTSSVEVDSAFSSCLFGAKTDAVVGAAGGVPRGVSHLLPARTSAADASGCRSPGALISGLRQRDGQQKQRSYLNRSFSSAGSGGGGTWSSITACEKGDFLPDAGTNPSNHWDTTTDDERNQDAHRVLATALNGKPRKANSGDKGSRDDSTTNPRGPGNNNSSGYSEPLEMEIINSGFNMAFLSSASATRQTSNGTKRRSSSQRGHNSLRQENHQLSLQNQSTDDSADRMTKSEFGSISGIKSPPRTSRLLRRKRLQQDERGVMLSEQMNGFRGTDNLDDILLYIEGPEALRKSQGDQQQQQQTKKAKKKSASESGTNSTSNNGSIQQQSQSTNVGSSGAKKEKVRRVTEGDDESCSFSSGGGKLNYKHRSTDSLGPPGPASNEDERRSLAECGKSTSSDGGINASQRSSHNDDGASSSNVGSGKVAANQETTTTTTTMLDSAVTTGDALFAKQLHMDELKEAGAAAECDAPDEMAPSAAADDEQFIPVTNKKQKKTKSEQLRATVMIRPSRSGKWSREPEGTGGGAQRSVTPPARESAAASGRRRRNSFDHVRVRGIGLPPPTADVEPPSTEPPSATMTTMGNTKGVLCNKQSDIADGGGASTTAANAPQQAIDDSSDSRPSYANVAAHRRVHSPPMLGDFIAETISKTKFHHHQHKKRGGPNYAGSRGGRMTRDDGERSEQVPRQSSSLNASRSTSPVGIPTAVATNLANASSPDLKNFTGELIYHHKNSSHVGGGRVPSSKMTYATIAADKRPPYSIVKPAATVGGAIAGTSSENQMTPVVHPTTQAITAIDDVGDKSATVDGSAAGGDDIPGNGGGCNNCDHDRDAVVSSLRKDLTDTAVNTEPFIPPISTMIASSVSNNTTIPTTAATTNLGEQAAAFTFEHKASTSEEVRGVVRTAAGDRRSCSGVFQSPPLPYCGNSTMESGGNSSKVIDQQQQQQSVTGGLRTNSNSINVNNCDNVSNSGCGGRERRNSCPVQFLDKAGACFNNKPVNISGLNFVYGDTEEDEEICAALARSTTTTTTATTTTDDSTPPPIANPPAVVSNDNKDNNEAKAQPPPSTSSSSSARMEANKGVSDRRSIRCADDKPPDVASKIPTKVLHSMVNYVSSAWTEFTRDSNSTVYYHTDNQ